MQCEPIAFPLFNTRSVQVGILSVQPESKHIILSLLLRASDFQGVVRIDGVDITELRLQDLRESIAVIPGDLYLFSGGMRRNLDPYGRHPDANVWKVKPTRVRPKKINTPPPPSNMFCRQFFQKKMWEGGFYFYFSFNFCLNKINV